MMRRYTQKELKNLCSEGYATNITNYSFEEIKQLRNKTQLSKIGYSAGVNGINGGLLEDINTGEKYAITARNSTLLMIF